MITYLRGKIDRVEENLIVLETPLGIAFEIIATSAACAKFNGEKSEVKIETYLQVREDAFILFGFENKNEKNMFLKLITVSGVGPKLATTILSGTDPTSLAIAILNSDVTSLSKIKGLGKKTAEKIVVELREKVGREDDLPTSNKTPQLGKIPQNVEDAAFALCALGISKTDAVKFAGSVATPEMSSEDIIRKCLREMGR